MQIIQCPKCKQQLLTPGQKFQAIAKCPVCDEEFSLGDVIGEPIAIAEIVRSEAAENIKDELAANWTSEVIVESQIDQDVDDRPVEQEQETKPDFSFESETVQPHSVDDDIPSPFTDENASSTSPVLVKTQHTSRRLKKGSHGLSEVIKISCGGVAGIFIAQMILWWLPAKWRTDPLKLAPKLPQAIAFLAPASLRVHVDQTSQEIAKTNSKTVDFANIGLNRQPNSEDKDDEDSSTDLPSNTDQISSSEEDILPEPVQENDIQSTDFEVVADQIVGLLHVPLLSVSELDVHLRQANAALTELQDNATDSSKQKRLYVRMAELARTVTYLNRSEQGAAERLESAERFVGEVASNAYRAKVIGVGASGWIKYRRRSTTGIAITCSVREISAVGDFFEVKGAVAGRNDVLIKYLTRTHPKDDVRYPYDIGANVIVLGTIIDDPESQIEGYSGSDAVAVWEGLHVTFE